MSFWFSFMRDTDLLVALLLHKQLNGIADKLRVLLDDLLDATLLRVLDLVLLQVQDDLSATAERLTRVGADGERAASTGLPDVLLVIIVLRVHGHLVGNQVGRVEAHTELTDHGDISSGLQGLHERLGARLGNGAEVVDQVGLGHADASVDDGESLFILVGDDANVEVLDLRDLSWVGERLVADFV
ncbi:hypothetical protein TYRP_004582 [Tyrophagus putrescentiae]|nr:hypothetical protein TYRP_004582 [Tyrophagus putrescentiae]